MENDSKEGVVLSGMRPTGQLHIGHFEAVLQNWVKLQETHDCFYFVADWHATTTEESTAGIPDFAIDNVADWLAFGIEPDKSTVFVQSHVPEHFELAAHLLPLVNYGRLVRMPTFKGFVDHIAGDRVFRDDDRILEGDERLEAAAKRDITSAFVVYPVIQAADILIYDTTHVPVGEDQVPHVELTRDLAGAFNRRYGDIF
ncbi:hypothetical protein HOC32_04165, partial [Candidatus Woesearchaeota archaeon]|nr:hypothetical protein [Candidatus Woesearchaeota archaeon]